MRRVEVMIQFVIDLVTIIFAARADYVIICQPRLIRQRVKVERSLAHSVETGGGNNIAWELRARVALNRQWIKNPVRRFGKTRVPHFFRWHGADKRQPLPANVNLRRNEEECLATISVVLARPVDRPAQRAAELIQHEMVKIGGAQEEVTRVEGRVTVEFVK